MNNYQIEKSINELSYRFSKATRGVRDNTRGSRLHGWQVDFMYHVHGIRTSPSYIVPKYITNATEFVDSVEKEVQELKKSA